MYKILRQENTTAEMIAEWIKSWKSKDFENLVWTELGRKNYGTSGRIANKIPLEYLVQVFNMAEEVREVWVELEASRKSFLMEEWAARSEEPRTIQIIESLIEDLSVADLRPWGKGEIKKLLASKNKDVRIRAQQRLGQIGEGLANKKASIKAR